MGRLILQHLDKRRTQTLSVVLSILLTVAAVFALLLVWSGVSGGIATSQARMGADIIAVPEDVRDMISDGELLFTGAPVAAYMDESELEEIGKINGVEKVTPQFYGQTLNSGCCTTGKEQRIIGFDPGTDWIISPWMDRETGKSMDPDEIIIGSAVGGFESGSGKVLGETFHVAAVLEPTDTGLDNSLFVTMETVRRLVRQTEGYEHYWEKYGDPDELISAVMVKTAGDNKGGVANRIEMKDHMAAISSVDVLDDIQQRMDLIFWIMAGGSMLFLIAMIVTLFGRFWTMAWDRKSELGLYRALGASKRDLRNLIMGEALIITGAGAICGMMAGGGLYVILMNTLVKYETFPYDQPSAGTVVIAAMVVLLCAAVVGCLSVIRPLRQIRKIDPSLAIVKGDID